MSPSLLNLDQIREMLASGRYHLSGHALTRIVVRNISAEMIRQAGSHADIIEDYPDDKYAPSCLLLGYDEKGTPLHLHVSKLRQETVKIVTLYVPDPERWNRDRIRKAQS